MIAYGIKLSIDNGFAGDVVLEAKTTQLAQHYERDFGAVLLPALHSSAPRYLIADEAAKRIFFTYLACLLIRRYPIMNDRKNRPISDAEWYFRKDPETKRFYEIFFQLCRKYNVHWANATLKEKEFIEEVTRVTYERERAQQLGLPLSEVRPSFAS